MRTQRRFSAEAGLSLDNVTYNLTLLPFELRNHRRALQLSLF
jgi:hypothetical protein